MQYYGSKKKFNPHNYVDDYTYSRNWDDLVACYKSMKRTGKTHVYRIGNKMDGHYKTVNSTLTTTAEVKKEKS